MDPLREKITHLLKLTLVGMSLTYFAFTLGLARLLFGQNRRVGIALIAMPAFLYASWCFYRNHRIRAMGFTTEKPCPRDWSSNFEDREKALFRRFTTLWTAMTFFWAVLQKILR